MENGKRKSVIRSFQDLEVYQRLYQAMLEVMNGIIPKLPKEEKFDLADQIRRCCKAPLALLAEGFAKRYQARSWRKYLDDTMGECNEMIHHLSVCRDVYKNNLDSNLCQKLIKEYDLANRQLYHLRKSWQNFHKQN